MKISEDNVYSGAVLTVTHGAVNDEVEIVLDGSAARITSVITNKSVKTLGLAPGKKVLAIFTPSNVVLLKDAEGTRFSARNQLEGTVTSVKDGAVNAQVQVRLDCGETLTAMTAIDSLKKLGLEAGARVTALIKASSIILGIRE
ncbi:MAG: TOBE domain-containing protein [Synergistaceae bacterium]|nr:TOBE domain-containing protein [Synergistaceae bacterium]